VSKNVYDKIVIENLKNMEIKKSKKFINKSMSKRMKFTAC